MRSITQFTVNIILGLAAAGAGLLAWMYFPGELSAGPIWRMIVGLLLLGAAGVVVFGTPDSWPWKVLALLLGAAGVVVVQLVGAGSGWDVALKAALFILLVPVYGAVSTFINRALN